MTVYRARASASRVSSARYASSASRLTRHTPFRPILSAGSSPPRINVYTCETVTLSTAATSDGFSRGAGSSSTATLLEDGQNMTLRDVAWFRVPKPSDDGRSFGAGAS